MQPSAVPGKKRNANTKPATLLPAALEEGMRSAERSRPLRLRFPRMERDCPPASERFWVIGGRPGNFKTQLMWNMAINMAELHQRVLFVSLEMPPGELALQAVSRYARIPTGRALAALRKHDPVPFNSADGSVFYAAAERFLKLSAYLRLHGAEESGRSIGEVLANATQHAYDAVFIDHAGMIGRDSGRNELECLAEAIHALRGLSRGEVDARCHPFVCAASPLSRDGEKQAKDDEERMPRLADLRGSSRLEHDVDVAMIVKKRKGAEDEETSIVDAFVLKQRQGKCPIVLQFDAQGAIGFVTERHKEDHPPRQHWAEREPGEEG